MGSFPRTNEILAGRRKVKAGRLSPEELDSIVDEETKKVVRLQERCGMDIICNGELSRDNYVSFVANRLNNLIMLSMSEMIDYIEDKKAFEQILDTLDVPSATIKNAICDGLIEREKPIVAHEMRQLKSLTGNPIKATLPGPYLMTRSMWLYPLSGKYYKSKEDLGEDVIRVLKAEIDELEELGVEILQFDEPVLTEVVFTEGKTRSFMCAALSEKKDPTEELEFATHLLKSIMDYVRPRNIIGGMHVCRGNWSKDESVLLSGPYTPLVKLFETVAPEILFLEFSTPRAGELISLLQSEKICENSAIGIGVVNPRTDSIESWERIVSRVEQAMKLIPKEKILLNPDCGFATFANRPVSTLEVIEAKLKQLKKAQQYLKEKYEC